jgi:hypothetical protein
MNGVCVFVLKPTNLVFESREKSLNVVNVVNVEN